MSTGYDAIAQIYDIDMGASRTLPDVRYYLAIAQQTGGPVLELGCGTGRVMSALLGAGIDAYGVDLSGEMLRQARARLGARAPLMQMDIRHLGLDGRFALVLLPYSLVTYLKDDAEWQQLAGGLRRALKSGGRVLLDAFIPQPIDPALSWMRDYARMVGDAWLVRHKRIQPLGSHRNRIERRYRQPGAFGGRTLVTREDITTYDPQELKALTERHIGPVERMDLDYGAMAGDRRARFLSLVARCSSAC